jgi:hypothetical protein
LNLRYIFYFLKEIKILFILVISLSFRIILFYFHPEASYPPWNEGLLLYGDYHYYYLNWFKNTSKALVPYLDFWAQYPPLFIYGLLPFYTFFGNYGPAALMVISDALSPVIIFLIMKHVASEKVAFFFLNF